MSKTGRRLGFKKRRKLATFHVEDDFSAGWRKRNVKRMGYGRTVFTAFSLVLGLGSGYVALHYLPAVVSPSHVLRVSDLDQQSLAKKPKGLMAYVAPYWTSLQSRRSYIWSGESVEVQYRLEKGNKLDLVVERCARQVVREVFDCQVVSREEIRVTGRSGIHRLSFSEPGFYHFREKKSGGSRVIWRRV